MSTKAKSLIVLLGLAVVQTALGQAAGGNPNAPAQGNARPGQPAAAATPWVELASDRQLGLPGEARADFSTPLPTELWELGPIPAEVLQDVREGTVGRSAVSPRGQVAWSEQRGARWVCVVNGVAGEAWDWIPPHYPVFSPSGDRLAYVAQRDEQQYMVIDGELGPAFQYIAVGPPAFSAHPYIHPETLPGVERDQRRTARVGIQGGKSQVYVERGGTEEWRSPWYDGVAEGFPIFSPDGERFTFVAFRGDEHYVNLDGAEFGPWAYTARGTPVFSPDGRRIAFEAARRGGPHAMVLDGSQDGTARAAFGTPRFSANGEHLGYRAQVGERWTVVIDGREVGAFEQIPEQYPVVANNGVAYFGGINGEESFLVISGREPIKCDRETPIIQSTRDGEHVVCIVGTPGDENLQGTTSVMIDGEARYTVERPTGTIIGGRPLELALFEDAQGRLHTAHTVFGFKVNYPVWDGVVGGAYGEVWKLTFEPTTGKLAFVGNDWGDPFVSFGKWQGPCVSEVLGDLKFTPTAPPAVVYAAQVGDRETVFINGRCGQAFDKVFETTLSVDADGTVRYVAAREGKLFRVLQRPA